ncbi:hypothetical protein VUR80DRAFT_2930 [Thermomyces stellatus]
MTDPVLVLGATGTQGGSVARHLRKAGIPVHALVRDPSSTKAKALESLGVVLFKGSWDDTEALALALKGTKAAFLNFYPSLTDLRQELRDAETVLAAAKAAGVKHIVYSGLLGIDTILASLPSDLGSNAFMAPWFQTKKDTIDAVVSAGFEMHTILLPGKFMSDFYTDGGIWYGDLSKTGVFETTIRPEEKIHFVDPDDIGALAAAAFTDTGKFAGQTVDVVTEVLSADEAIRRLSEATGKKMNVRYLSDTEVEERVKVNVLAVAQLMTGAISEVTNMDKVKAWGVPVGSFANFLERESATLKETYSGLPDAN